MSKILSREELVEHLDNPDISRDWMVEQLFITLDQRTKERDKLQKIFKELQLSFHSCLHPTPYHEREWSKNDEGDWQYETISYLPLRKRLQNDNARLNEQNVELKAKVESLEYQNRKLIIGANVVNGENQELKEENEKLKERIDGVCGDCSYWGVGGQEGRFRDCRMDKRVHKINDGCQEWAKQTTS